MLECVHLYIFYQILSSFCLLESTPELLSAVQVSAGSTVEIAAASVGDTSLVEVVHVIKEDENGLSFTAVTEILEESTEMEAKEALEETAAESEEVLETGEAVVKIEAPAEEKVAVKTSAPAALEEEQEVAASPDESLLQTEEKVEDVGTEDQALVTGAAPPEEATPAEEASTAADAASPDEEASSTNISPEDSVSAEAAAVETDSTEASPEDAEAVGETTPAEGAASDTPVDETPAAVGSVEETVAESEEAAEVVETQGDGVEVVKKTVQLAAASGSDLEILSTAEPEPSSDTPARETTHCTSCHSNPSLAEEVAPPAAFEDEDAEDVMSEAQEEVSLVEGKNTETTMMVSAQS
ncbi:fibrous sheath CABYR-binding protein-like [Xyrichtys novacula]|uniref:Fibrous sheath CABYR-binding protein-like n=1 Tax=Xyrichtys novacula TaxID=13765 RepID=A0AAV1EW86_XYRNO|nr:fibrous sheath CABYR-binding protein-like [Xyrichtys novacula]